MKSLSYQWFLSLLLLSHSALGKAPLQKTNIDRGLISHGLVATFRGEKKNCFIHKDFVILETAVNARAESDILLFRRKKGERAEQKSCQRKESEASLVLKNQVATYFSGIHGDFLFLDGGSGNDRGLSIYSISKQKSVKETGYDGQGFQLVDNTLIDRDSEIEKKELSPKETPICPRREQKEFGYIEQYRCTRKIFLKDMSENISQVKCEIRYEE